MERLSVTHNEESMISL